MEQAIKKAIEGGWKWQGSKVKLIRRGHELRFQHKDFTERVEISALLLDPLFWQALGKSLGWEEEENHYWECKKCTYTTPYFSHNDPEYCKYDGKKLIEKREKIPSKQKGWLSHWHRFIDHLAEGKDPESFFTSLLTK